MIRNLLLEKKIFEAEAEVDAFIKENEIDLESNTLVQSLIFDKEVFEEESEAREWAVKHGFHSNKVDETEDSFRLRQYNPSQFEEDSFRTIEIRRGIKAVIGKLQSMEFDSSPEEIYFSEKGEVNLGHKVNTIDLSEGMPHIIEVARVAEGEHPAYGKLKITKETLKSFVKNFKSNATGVDLSINEDHKKNEAFGWFKDVFLSYDEEVCYAQVVWNSKGTTALSEKEYRYFSPEFRFNYKHPHSQKEFGPTLLGGALTNYPFLKMEAITELNNKQEMENVMSKETTIDLSVHNEKVVELSSKITNLEGEKDVLKAQNIELNDKVAELEKTIELNEKKAMHQKLFDEGKINKAQLDAMNAGKGMLEVIALSEKMNGGKGSSETPKTETIELSDKDRKMIDQLGITEEEYVKFNK